MKVLEKTRPEIEAKLKILSDFLKMEYLEGCIKQNIDFNVKRFCNGELAKLYEKRNMFSEAAKNMSSVAEMAVTYTDKMSAYVGETGYWIRAGYYDRADESFKKALASGNNREKEEVKKAVVEIYKKQAEAYEISHRNSNALKIYEKMLQMVQEHEKLEVRKKILNLYHKLGKIREYTHLNQQLNQPQPAASEPPKKSFSMQDLGIDEY